MFNSIATSVARCVSREGRERGASAGIAHFYHKSILDTVGNTPLVRLSQKLVPRADVNLLVKCEMMNPMSSVKDRLALGVIEWGEKNGHLLPGQTVVECTSGNTGIGLAMVCSSKGYPFVAVMSESFSIERRKLMRFLGAKVILTNPAHKGSGMLIKAQELSEKHGWFLPRQFENEANADIHAKTTGPELVKDLSGNSLDHVFCSYGTGGTLQGIGRHLRMASPETKIHVCEPDNAPLLYSGIGSEWKENGTVKAAHPLWRPHLLQGWAPDFIPPLVQQSIDMGLIDQLHHVNGDTSMEMAKRLAQSDGIFTGPSGGGCLSAAIDFAQDEDACATGSNIVAILPDTGERYLSTPMFSGVPSDMTDEERLISDSTPSEAPPPIDLPEASDKAKEFVLNRISSSASSSSASKEQKRIIIFSLVSCEFCWTAFGLLEAIGLGESYETIDIDSFEFAPGNYGNEIRAALQEETGVATFPQIFIDGKFLGGAVDLCLQWKSGELQPTLRSAGLEVNSDRYQGDPFEFLPKWMSANPLRTM